jgi:hypothetical protein
MKIYIYIVGVFVFTLAGSGLSAPTLAKAAITKQGEEVREGKKQDAEFIREQQKQSTEIAREQQKRQFENASSSTQASSTRPSIKGGDDEDEFDLELEEEDTLAFSNDDLTQKIEMRKRKLEQEVASSSPERQVLVKNANEVRLAVHALLASKDLVGGIGQQVSEIAKEMNNSVASTTNAEAKIQTRGFLIRLLFGGDSTSAEIIAQQAAQNQTRIDSLTALLNQTNISTDVQATLKVQIAVLQDAQVRLQNLAQKEKGAWGLFSWRF